MLWFYVDKLKQKKDMKENGKRPVTFMPLCFEIVFCAKQKARYFHADMLIRAPRQALLHRLTRRRCVCLTVLEAYSITMATWSTYIIGCSTRDNGTFINAMGRYSNLLYNKINI